VRRLLALGLAALDGAALTAGIAQAALWLNFSRTSAEPGGTVFVRTAGTGALAGVKQWPVRVYPGRADPIPLDVPFGAAC